MKAGILLFVTALLMNLAATSKRARELADATQWAFEDHNDSELSNYVGSCYRSQYTYYKSFKCDTMEGNCVNQVNYCTTLNDPLDDYTDKTGYYLSIILPSVLGGGGLICCICACCAVYFGSQAYVSYRERQ